VIRTPGVLVASDNSLARTVKRPVAGIVLASMALNIVANSILPPLLHIPISLATAASVTRLGVKAGVTLDQQGMALRTMPRGAVYGLATFLPIAIALGAASRHRTLGTYYQQEDIAAGSPGRTAYEAFVRIPWGTALPEEMIFRGTTMALLGRRRSPLATVVLSSALFGLWHAAPTAQRLNQLPHVKNGPPKHQLAHIAGSVASTAVAGLALGWLRVRSDSIVAPWFAHSTANATAFIASWLTARNRRPRGSGA
jgi:uncharacterized protein